ncbi:anti-sigma regulatory factor [Bacillus suaedaesalsae]|uniref:Anti-sigma regulatory factor n=1 Tax=Bacillus suaedaesalsae TaxID=2810349 RepID=A0ABS2DGV9_9BACI|nr:anti-sigma regulatory factor [Bacillus suaedaesalsae]MBM6617695.1 anti-sigma regulatory factor [Bacillus suaedaesalsae]
MEVQSYVKIITEWDIVAARQMGREIAKQLGFGNVDQARIATAISELARNIYLYAVKGSINLEIVKSGEMQGLVVKAVDEGPGISDIRKVMEDGYSSSGGLGAGLPGVKRLMDDFSIESEVGRGTEIIAVKWLR